MTAKEVIEFLSNTDPETEVFFRAARNPCGNIWSVNHCENSNHGCFGISVPCVILEYEEKE